MVFQESGKNRGLPDVDMRGGVGKVLGASATTYPRANPKMAQNLSP